MQWFIRRFINRICYHVDHFRPERVVDIGCGEGIVAGALQENNLPFEYYGIDINKQSIETAKRLSPSLFFETANFLTMNPKIGWADVVLCLEVLEHLKNPVEALRRLLEWSNNVIIVSVPWEPYFSIGNFCRGLYMNRFGNHPEHVQWFRKGAFKVLLSQVSSNFLITTCFPWLIGIITI